MNAGKKGRNVPRAFDLHWGNGVIAEEATYSGEHHEPSIRFCYYDHAGRFQRSPLVVGNAEIDGLRGALAETPRLRELLKEMVT